MPSTQKSIANNHIDIAGLQEQLTDILFSVSDRQVQYTVTSQSEPIVILRPYTHDDAHAAWEKAADQEIAEMLESAKRIGDICRQKGIVSLVDELEKMREESFQRCINPSAER